MYLGSGLVRITAALMAWALFMLVLPAALALPLAVGHAQVHAIFALVVLLPALALASRRGSRPTIASKAPIVGLATVAVAQLVESVGALGYGPDNDLRANGLVALHDIGLAITPLGLIAALAGITVGIGVLVRRRTGRPALTAALSVVFLIFGGFGLSKLLGF
jgi:hypothetical protein